MSFVHYKPATSEIPTKPGVYVFRDAHNRVLYVGKAKNLRNRLSSYFGKVESLAERTQRMVTSANQVSWTVVNTELEALQLEFTWIKEFAPPFNVQFRDDKSYPYLAFTTQDKFARVYITRNRHRKKDTYFGPFTKTWAIRDTLDHLLPVFPVRSCADGVFQRAQRAQRPCLLGDIGRCSAPCAGRVTQEEHAHLAQEFMAFMAGKNDSLVRVIKQRMEKAAADQRYELAAKLRDQVVALESVLEKSVVVLSTQADIDVFGIARDELSAAVRLFIVRSGRIRGVRSWAVDTELDIDVSELMSNALRVAYEGDLVPPATVCVPEMPSDSAAMQEWLTERRRASLGTARYAQVDLKRAQRGELAALARTVTDNAQQDLALFKLKRGADYVARTQALTDLQAALQVTDPLLRIECFDISHLSGTNIVGSMVVFEDGLAKKSHYKKFKVANSRDDTDSLDQVLTRRLKYLAGMPESVAEEDSVVGGSEVGGSEAVQRIDSGFAYPPSLFVVDGGAPQVNAAYATLVREGFSHIPVIGIAKRLEEIWLPGNAYPLILPRSSSALFLMQQLRDEAHRVAISFNRRLRSSSAQSVLTEIPGLGKAKIAILLKKYKSVVQIKNTQIDELATTKGISRALAQDILDRLNS